MHCLDLVQVTLGVFRTRLSAHVQVSAFVKQSDDRKCEALQLLSIDEQTVNEMTCDKQNLKTIVVHRRLLSASVRITNSFGTSNSQSIESVTSSVCLDSVSSMIPA